MAGEEEMHLIYHLPAWLLILLSLGLILSVSLSSCKRTEGCQCEFIAKSGTRIWALHLCLLPIGLVLNLPQFLSFKDVLFLFILFAFVVKEFMDSKRILWF